MTHNNDSFNPSRKGSVLMPLCLAVAIGLMVGLWAWRSGFISLGHPDEGPDRPWKIAILDYGALARASLNAADDDAQKGLILAHRNQVKRLVENGFVVLDAAAVVAAPEDLYVHKVLTHIKDANRKSHHAVPSP